MVLAASAGLQPASDENKDTWTGILVDSDCPTKPSNMCEVTESTILFGIVASDGTYAPFDHEGNHQAKTAISQAQKRRGAFGALVRGRMQSAILHVDFLRVL